MKYNTIRRWDIYLDDEYKFTIYSTDHVHAEETGIRQLRSCEGYDDNKALNVSASLSSKQGLLEQK